MNLPKYLERRRHLIDEALERWVPGGDEFPPLLHQAMRYSLFAGGKRLRPILALAAAEAVEGRIDEVLPLACSLELIHTYSLIHDDLPAMDNDDLRRGKPTNHRVYGEALALLSGDALLTEAFRLLSRPEVMKNISPRRRLQAIAHIALAAGSLGMVGGQTMDMIAQGQEVEPEIVEYIHRHKTGALIAASVVSGAIVGGGSARECQVLQRYGEKIGLAFQVIDDILDVHGEARKMGKAVRKDQSQGKATYPALFGITESRRKAEGSVSEALDELQGFSRQANPLREIAKFIIQRTS